MNPENMIKAIMWAYHMTEKEAREYWQNADEEQEEAIEQITAEYLSYMKTQKPRNTYEKEARELGRFLGRKLNIRRM